MSRTGHGEQGEYKNAFRAGVFLLLILLSGFLAAFVIARINQARFGLYLWPLILCADMFAFTTAGFFSSDGKAEFFYGACSIACAACLILQLAILF